MQMEGSNNILLCLRYGIGDLIMEVPIIDPAQVCTVVRQEYAAQPGVGSS